MVSEMSHGFELDTENRIKRFSHNSQENKQGGGSTKSCSVMWYTAQSCGLVTWCTVIIMSFVNSK